MYDREKVINGLEYHLKELSVGKTCFECPYCGNNPCEIQLITDALVLLKAQEPVEPRKILPCITRPVGGYVCGHCGIRFLEKNDYYCSNCGRAVKWDV